MWRDEEEENVAWLLVIGRQRTYGQPDSPLRLAPLVRWLGPVHHDNVPYYLSQVG
jgi:hypothetical protein